MKRFMELSSPPIGVPFGGSFREQIQEWRHRLFVRAKASLSRRQLKPEERPVVAVNQRPSHAESDAPQRGERLVVQVASPAKPKQYMIFPGAAAIRNGDVPPKPWEKSQWIE